MVKKSGQQSLVNFVVELRQRPKLYESEEKGHKAIIARYPRAQRQTNGRRQCLYYEESDGSGAIPKCVAALSKV